MIDRTHVKAHRMAASLKRGSRPRTIICTKGGLNSKLHMVSDGRGQPLTFFLSPGQMGDARGALVLLGDLTAAKRILGDKGCKADWPRKEPRDRGLMQNPSVSRLQQHGRGAGSE